MKTYAVRAATLLASVCLAASACGDSASPMGPDADQAPGISPAAVFSEDAVDSEPGKYLPTSGSETPADGGEEVEMGGSEPGKYLPTSGSEAPADGDAELGTDGGTGGDTTADGEPGKYLPTSGSEAPTGGAELEPESGTGGETDETPAEQQ